jgi:hypothetical protein
MEKPYTCMNARRDVNLFFSIGPSVSDGASAFWRIMGHMVSGDIIKHRIVCKTCWRYYLRKKRETIERFEREKK